LGHDSAAQPISLPGSSPTIKPSDPDRQDSTFVVNRNGTLIKLGWNVHPRQISGAPACAESDKSDITAKPDVPGISKWE
jgi:hypothetical protein